ncbi:hypothetical protein WKK05_11410 [Nostoc sp. UHCC 0302]
MKLEWQQNYIRMVGKTMPVPRLECIKTNYSTSWLMRHRLGLRPVLMDLFAGVEVTGTEAVIQAVSVSHAVRLIADFSKRNAPHIKGILNLTIPLDESPIWVLGQYLEQLGLSTESRQPVEDGKRVRYYRLNTLAVAFVQQVLEYRQQQREQRESKRQEEQERHAAYAAMMQAQYGIEIDRPSSNLPSTPPTNKDGSNNWGGMDGQQNLSNPWWNRVKY